MDRRNERQMKRGLEAHKGNGEVPRYVGSLPEVLSLLSASY